MTPPKKKGRVAKHGPSLPIPTAHFTEKLRRGLFGMIDVPLDGSKRCFVCLGPHPYCEYFQPDCATRFSFRFRVCDKCWNPFGVPFTELKEIQGHIKDAGKSIAKFFVVANAAALRKKRRISRQAGGPDHVQK